MCDDKPSIDRPAEVNVSLEMINAGVEAIMGHDIEHDEPEALAFAIAYRVLSLDRDRKIRAAQLL